MIALTLYDGKDTPIMVRGTHREAALQCEKIIREYRLVDGRSCFNDLHATRNLMFYLANVMVEVHDEQNVEADYTKIDGTKAQHAESDIKKRKRLAARDDRSLAKTPKNRKIAEGENDPTRFKQAFKQDAGSKATKLKSVAISQATAPARAGSAARYTNRGAISGRPTMAALKRS